MASRSPHSAFRFADPLRLVLWVVVLIGVVAGVRSASFRWNREQDNRRVEIALDFAELRSLAASEGVPLPEILKQFKAAGATSVAVQEETISGLEDARQIMVLPSNDGMIETRLIGSANNGIPDPLSGRIERALREKTRFTIRAPDAQNGGPIIANQPWSVLRGVGIGLDPGTVELVHAAGLGIVGRVSNWNGVTPRGLAWTLAELKKQGASTVLFSGDEVLGYRGYVAAPKGRTIPPAPDAGGDGAGGERPPDSASPPSPPASGAGGLPESPTTDETLRSLDLFYGALEFGKQKADGQLAKAVPDRVVRVHTIPGSEMLSATVPDAVQRFSLAARERNIRLLFVRLFLDEPDAVPFNTDYVAKVVRALERGNLRTGTAHGYGMLSVGTVPRLLIGFAIGAGFLLLVDAITGVLSGGMGWVMSAGCWVVGIGLVALAASPVAIGVKLAALAAALIFPSLGLLANDLLDKDTAFKAIGRFLFACIVTLFGVACVVGLLADRAFLVKADAFIGIKATLSVPVLLVAIVYALDLRARSGRTFLQAVGENVDRFVRVSRQPLLLWQIVAATAALGLVFVILSRSGNESAVGVSELELKIRAVLDRVFLARPRFKDVFGHAAMVLSLFLFVRTRQRVWALPLFILGVFGQVSLLNTFCHLHTPLAVSLWRAFLGIALGLIIGSVLFALLNRFVLRHAKSGMAGDNP
ncbi:MAG: hypothetical protein H7145_10445 [Akkermansiaceae bacterium]|nr:hypothetical protein [Armatimonadota bacterium]